MANYIKDGQTYTSPHGLTLTGQSDGSVGYMRIFEVTVCQTFVHYLVKIWVDQAARNAGDDPLQEFDVDVAQEDADMATYFSDSVLSEDGISPLTQAYKHFATKGTLYPGVDMGDWKSDESGGVPVTLPR